MKFWVTKSGARCRVSGVLGAKLGHRELGSVFEVCHKLDIESTLGVWFEG